MKNIFIYAAFVFLAACTTNNKVSNTNIQNQEITNTNGDSLLLGRNSLSQLNKMPYAKWFITNYNNYKVDTLTIEKMKPLVKNKTVEIFLGSWCGDTKREVPKVIKILQAAEVDTSNIHLIFVGRGDNDRKQSPQHEEAGKFIHNVATVIFYDEKEIGRIVETPLESWEKDIVTILSKLPYTPKYKALYYWNNKVKNKSKTLTDIQLNSYASSLKPLTKHSGELNSYGYVLLAAKKHTEAINIFKINCILYPNDVNVFDSLGEAYETIGDKLNAKLIFEKIVELDPKNTNAIEKLKRL